MKIYIIDSFLGDSHKQWAESYKNFSSHKVEILGLSGHHWKWRMTGGAISLADKLNQKSISPDLIIATDMVNIPLFKSLLSPITHSHTLPAISITPKGLVPLEKEATGAINKNPSALPNVLACPGLCLFPQGQMKAELPRAAASHSASVGRRLPAH